MNRFLPVDVKVRCLELQADFMMKSSSMVRNGYGAEHLNYKGELILFPDEFMKLLDTYLKEVR